MTAESLATQAHVHLADGRGSAPNPSRYRNSFGQPHVGEVGDTESRKRAPPPV